MILPFSDHLHGQYKVYIDIEMNANLSTFSYKSVQKVSGKLGMLILIK